MTKRQFYCDGCEEFITPVDFIIPDKTVHVLVCEQILWGENYHFRVNYKDVEEEET